MKRNNWFWLFLLAVSLLASVAACGSSSSSSGSPADDDDASPDDDDNDTTADDEDDASPDDDDDNDDTSPADDDDNDDDDNVCYYKCQENALFFSCVKLRVRAMNTGTEENGSITMKRAANAVRAGPNDNVHAFRRNWFEGRLFNLLRE